MPTYSLDTSSLVAAWLERYPIDNFEGFWARLDELLTNGTAVASVEVLLETKKRDEALHKWLRSREKCIVEIDDVCQDRVTEIMGKYPKFVDTRTGKNHGDPFVIALASTYEPPLMVISEESGGTASRPKIPFVCDEEKLKCVKLVDLIKRENWKFRS